MESRIKRLLRTYRFLIDNYNSQVSSSPKLTFFEIELKWIKKEIEKELERENKL